MLIKTIDAKNLYLALKQITNGSRELPSKFLYRAVRNMHLLEPIAQALEKATDPDSNSYLKEYNVARRALLESICLKDSNGVPLSRQNKYVFDPADAGDKALNEFNKSYPDLTEHVDKFYSEIKDISEHEEEIDLLTVAEDYLPDTLPAETMLALVFMIK